MPKLTLTSLKGLQRFLADLVLELRPAELDRGNAQGYAQLVRQLVLVTDRLDAQKQGAAGKPIAPHATLTEESIAAQQEKLDEWRAKLDRRKKLGCTGDRAARKG